MSNSCDRFTAWCGANIASMAARAAAGDSCADRLSLGKSVVANTLAAASSSAAAALRNAVPPLVEGFRVEDLAWALMWQILDLAAERRLAPFAAYFHPDCLEAAALLRVSRTLNDGRPAQIFIRDGLGGVRELRVVNRSDPELIRRVLKTP